MAERGPPAVHTLELRGGRDKAGRPEACALCFRRGEVVCLVGPTGSGKSRLLADVECLAQGDTPSGRVVRIDGAAPDPDWRLDAERHPVAQITQTMSFVMDLPVGAFLHLHAESRALRDPGGAVRRVLAAANALAGEPFGAEASLTELSGGQSRALMIADAAHLSPKPIVLIDEIENAGVDRQRALALLVERGKIVLLSTHDPLLALSGTRRLVIAGGAVREVVRPTAGERRRAAQLARLDAHLSRLREAIRAGEAQEPAWHGLGRALALLPAVASARRATAAPAPRSARRRSAGSHKTGSRRRASPP